jgi:hypothetical protein
MLGTLQWGVKPPVRGAQCLCCGAVSAANTVKVTRGSVSADNKVKSSHDLARLSACMKGQQSVAAQLFAKGQ